MERDVIVVGAGPAGATTATILAQSGIDVLMIDRHTFPRDKICGDAVPIPTFNVLTKYGILPKVEAAIERGEFYPVDGMRLISPSGHEVKANFIYEAKDKGLKSCICPRIYFDNVIYEHAVDSGAQFLQGAVKGPIVENGKVVGVRGKFGGEEKEIRAKVVIGADGVSSAIARAIRPPQDKHEKHHKAVALRAYIDNFETYPKDIEFFLHEEILPGYGWIFPISERSANIGLGLRVDKYDETNEKLEDMLERFLQLPEIKDRTKNSTVRDVATWPLNFGSQRIQRAFDGAMLVGDAGGYINPLTGGGIGNAIITGEIAAHTAEAALLAKDTSRAFLHQYEQKSDDLLWHEMLNAWRFQRALGKYPKIINVLVRMLNWSPKMANEFFAKL